MADVERIASFQTDAIAAKAEREKSELAGQLAASEQEAAKTKERLTAENRKLRDAIKEAEKTVDAMARVMEAERKEAKRVAKENAENKGYADELEVAFNELHERYTKLKDYYTVADSKNVELSQSLLQTNELLQQSQAQVCSTPHFIVLTVVLKYPKYSSPAVTEEQRTQEAYVKSVSRTSLLPYWHICCRCLRGRSA